MFIFPAHILTPAAVTRRIGENVLAGGEAVSGESDITATDGGGRWFVEYQGIELADARAARVWEAWLEYLENGLTTCLVPLLSFATSPRAGNDRRRLKLPSGLYVDNPEWPTVMQYGLPEHVAKVAAPAALRATTLALATTKGPEPKGGELFSIGDRAYRVLRPLGGGAYAIRPPLREAVVADQPAVFDFPMVRARLDPGQDFSSPLTRGVYGTVGLRFVERTSAD